MAMDLRDPNVWISHLLENLPEEKLASALKDDNPNWEYIDGEIVKLGSLAHSQLDIPELQRRGLVILASESKDFRLLAHLLRTLQHAGDPHLALRLLALYVEHYWAVAAPQNMAHKKRFASQVIKRFETGIEGFSQNAATEQRDALSGELAKLAQYWQSHNAPELAQATDDLFALYQRAFNRAAAVGCSASLVCQTHCTEEAGMNSNVLTQTIVTGSDPRGLPEFSAIREEINKASHPSQPELNWKLVESLALAIFKANGVDLHTATYYTLARTRTQGLAGFCEGAELLAAMVSHDWDKFWPQGGPARTEMLDWFNSRTGNILRQQISFAESDLPLIYRTERALQLICDKLQQVELKRVPRVENLLYFMQNTRKRLEPQLKSNTENAAQTTVRTLIYAPETQASSTPEAVVPPLPGLPEMKVEVRSLTENPPQASVIKQGSTVRGFIAGIACSVAVASALWWWQVYPVQQQLLQVNDTAQGAATVWMASPELENYERRLQQLLDTSPVQPLETGMQMMRVADSRWPESLQQQQASTQWNEALKTRAQSSPQLRGWLQTRQDLHAFADLVMQREKEGLTLSYIKNVIWQAERGLGQETPVESLLTQYHDARAQKQNTDALEKQINERLEGVLSRWLLLKNNVMPEAATGTTAEK